MTMRGLYRLRPLVPFAFFLFVGAFGAVAIENVGLGTTMGAAWFLVSLGMGAHIWEKECYG